ncbi:MAG: hypothetical protein JNK85_10100 [Verrucomicrobiales bacterium]|nr:hypothetical protein [Verrucomicrobiales bacterium]
MKRPFCEAPHLAESAACVLGFMVFGTSLSFAVSATPAAPSGAPPVRRLGTNVMESGRMLFYKAPLNAYARSQLGRLGTAVPYVNAVLALPPEWESKPRLPLLVVCSPSGAPAVPGVSGYTNGAFAEGWAVLAADGPPLPADKDSVMWNWATVGSALDYLHQADPNTRVWQLAVGGFSGGAKRAACVAAAAMESGYEVKGVFMGGCNEDKVTTGALLYRAGPKFQSTPMFLSNGNQDPIAGPEWGAAVKASMERSGFRNTRQETYPGGHRLDTAQLRNALKWFGSPAGR